MVLLHPSHVQQQLPRLHTHIWGMSCLFMSRVTHVRNQTYHTNAWVVSHMHGSCDTNEWVTVHIQPQVRVWQYSLHLHTYVWYKARVTVHIQHPLRVYEWVMSDIWLSCMCTVTRRSTYTHMRDIKHVTHMNESCHTYGLVMLHIRMGRGSQVTHMNESGNACKWFMPHNWKIHIAHMNETCHTYARVICQMWMRHVTNMNEARGCICIVTHLHVWRNSWIHVPRPIDMCYTTHPYFPYDSSICVKCLIHMSDLPHVQVCR